MVNMPLADNLSNAYLEVYVPDGERRRGVGTALLAGLETAATSRGRTVLVAESFAPPDSAGPGEPFALARGYTLANREGVKVLDLVEHADGWAALDDHVADRIGDYRIVECRGTAATRSASPSSWPTTGRSRLRCPSASSSAPPTPTSTRT